ncbi:hypothetical protein MLD38_015563 [Melastoma candidum]|uniref:Uncharacterized protein n=1 Tax=Melastoma candidum TaxID=119954 RepID=A0ACB9RH39_9MYRT|nr:hypothetical protein MLD38_015563 [Melastoma candidum]
MAAIFSATLLTVPNRPRPSSTAAPPMIVRLRCGARGTDSATTTDSNRSETSESENALLKAAWYGSELLGIAASFFRSPPTAEIQGSDVGSVAEGSDLLDRGAVVDAIKEDYKRSYFVTGNLTLNVYEEDCEFADPAGSFKGLRRFKRNCTNFGSLLEKSNMKLMKWEDYEDKGIGHWRFSCILSFPWRPILSATGYTEYFYDTESGKVCRHVEHWNVPKMVLLKQILKPSRWSWSKDSGR